MDLQNPIDTGSLTEQRWAAYTAENHEVWRILYERRMRHLESVGSRVFLDGADLIGLSADGVPDLTGVNERLLRRTSWSAVAVTGFIPSAQFFGSIAERRFPTTITVRPMDQLDYLPEPDIFHDVFGHVPLHAHPVFASFLQRFGAVAASVTTEQGMTRMARLFWFTVEFGLVREDDRTKVYGSGLISSHGDCLNALGPNCDRRPFSLDAVWEQAFEIDRFQDVLFVIDSYDQLFEAVEEAGRRVGV
jgi:phenylalanine-4-hydroxylase